jgi:hypothetical protein
MAKHIALRFDWEDVMHHSVGEIVGLNARTMDDGSASWDAIAIRLANEVVLLSVDADTDQIIVTQANKPDSCGWVPISSLAFAIGKPLGWCWIGTNYRGYKDSFSIAFGDVVPDALEPRCMFLAEASAVSCFDLKRHMS